jgi:hypothetical protein
MIISIFRVLEAHIFQKSMYYPNLIKYMLGQLEVHAGSHNVIFCCDFL